MNYCVLAFDSDKKMKNIYFISLLLTLIAFGVPYSSVKADYNHQCPSMFIFCEGKLCCGLKREFGLGISGLEEDKKPTFKWTASSGKIIRGQETGSITVEAKDANELMKITVEIKNGFPLGCPVTAEYETECKKDCLLEP